MRQVRTLAVLGVLIAGCDDGDAAGVPWAGRTQVVQADAAKGTRECADLCAEAKLECAGAAVDIAVDRDGKPLDYLCYPEAPTWTVEDLAAHEGNIEQRENNTVLVLDQRDDGADITGDVSIDANNVVLYGESATTAVLDGSLTLDGNNALVRGVHITGDVTVVKNDVTLAFCVIDGDLIVPGNNVRVLGCDVLGSVRITGNNARLYGNDVKGAFSTGKNAECVDNWLVTNATGVIVRGVPLGC